jgi:hypothetical protein
MNLSQICSICSSVFGLMELRSFWDFKFLQISMHFLYLLSNCLGLPLKEDGGIILGPAD